MLCQVRGGDEESAVGEDGEDERFPDFAECVPELMSLLPARMALVGTSVSARCRCSA